MGDLRNAVEEFKKNIKKEKLKELKSIQDKGTIEVAVELAYDDAKRTMTGIGAHKDERKEAQGEIVEKLHSYFALSTAPDCNKFDELHKEMCELWHKRFEDIDNLGTYGKAQKIVNMAFKYLYCCEDANTKEEYFKYCHVALDSYTLEWFFREAGNKTYKIVKSVQRGIMQHDIYSWQLLGTEFIYLKDLTNGSEVINRTVRNWLKTTTPEQRGNFINVMYEVVSNTNVKAFKEFSASRAKNIGIILKTYKNIDEKDKKMIGQMIFTFLVAAKESIKEKII